MICSLINDLESAGPEDKPELLKTARYVRDAVEKVKNDSIDEEKNQILEQSQLFDFYIDQ